MESKSVLPPIDASEVWRRVSAYAAICLKEDRPIFTVSRRVENRITDVKSGSIGRISADGVTNSSRVTKRMVENLWSELQGGASGWGYLYFTKALVLAAAPELVEDMDGQLVLRNDPSVAQTKRQRRANSSADIGRTGGEGEHHRQLKEYIFAEPEEALKQLKSGPYQKVAHEYVFQTGDRVDVILIDHSGKVVLVEVKPVLPAGDNAPFAQAAKYRTLWNVLRDRPLSEIRCVVAAPEISKSPWKAMKNKYGIECVAVVLPESWVGVAQQSAAPGTVKPLR